MKSSFYIRATKKGKSAKITKANRLSYFTFINKVQSASLKKRSKKKVSVHFKLTNYAASWTGYYGIKIKGTKLYGYGNM